MPERHPAWVSGINDFEARLGTGMSLAPQHAVDHLDPLRVRSGIRDAHGNPGLVTVGQNKVVVNPFQAAIQDPARPALGAYVVTLDAPKELPFTAADPSSGRIDLVIAEIDPAVDPGFTVRMVEGERGANPQPPTVTNPLHLRLAQIQVPAGGATPTLTDLRQFTAALGGILPVRGTADLPPNAPGSLFVYRLDTRQLQVRVGGQWVVYRPPPGTADTWHAATLQSGWVPYGAGYASPAYILGDDGWVRLRGLVKAGALDRPIFTLPPGYRPRARHIFAVNTAPDAHGRLDVTVEGQVLPITGTNAWFALDGVSFATF